MDSNVSRLWTAHTAPRATAATCLYTFLGSDLPVKPRPSTLDRIRNYQTSLLEDLVAAVLIFILISVAWGSAPDSWPRIVYYVALVVGLFGYFKFVAPDPRESK